MSKPELFHMGVDTLMGTVTPGLRSRFPKDTLGKEITLTPSVGFDKAGPRLWKRDLQVTLSYGDSLSPEVTLFFTDTLPSRSLAKVRRTRFSELRGDSPKPIPRVVIPLTTILAGTVAVISLFYIRSN